MEITVLSQSWGARADHRAEQINEPVGDKVGPPRANGVLRSPPNNAGPFERLPYHDRAGVAGQALGTGRNGQSRVQTGRDGLWRPTPDAAQSDGLCHYDPSNQRANFGKG